MSWLYEQGYHVLPLNKLLGCLRDRIPPPRRSIVLTFDDGFECLYTTAFPILARYGFSGTVFLVTGYCGADNNWPGQAKEAPVLPLLDWEKIREMDRHGIEFGAHTVHHPRLDRLPPSEMKDEILNSKATIEQQLGHAVESFAYPYGRFDEGGKSVVKGAFSGACGTRLGLVGPRSDPFALERVEVHYLKSGPAFRSLSAPLFPLYLGLRRGLRAIASAVLQHPWY